MLVLIELGEIKVMIDIIFFTLMGWVIFIGINHEHNIEKACKHKCGKHPIITQNKEGSCLCNNTVTIEK